MKLIRKPISSNEIGVSISVCVEFEYGIFFVI